MSSLVLLIGIVLYCTSGFWATVCKTVRSLLSDRCLSVWTAGWLRGRESGLQEPAAVTAPKVLRRDVAEVEQGQDF